VCGDAFVVEEQLGPVGGPLLVVDGFDVAYGRYVLVAVQVVLRIRFAIGWSSLASADARPAVARRVPHIASASNPARRYMVFTPVRGSRC